VPAGRPGTRHIAPPARRTGRTVERYFIGAPRGARRN
jgi:hypothetical protein